MSAIRGTPQPGGVPATHARSGDRAGPGPRGGLPAPTLVDVSASWEFEARCRGEDASLFFGPNAFEPKRERLAREASAKAICHDCPAMQACREYAIVEGELFGVWGGLGEADRRPLIERHARVATAV